MSMMENTYRYESAIFYSPTLYSVLQKHLYGNAAGVIDACNYLGKENRYKIAIQKLTEAYGNKLSVIKAHRKKMLSGSRVGNNLTDFSKFKTELDCFKIVIDFYEMESSYASGDFICLIMTLQIVKKFLNI